MESLNSLKSIHSCYLLLLFCFLGCSTVQSNKILTDVSEALTASIIRENINVDQTTRYYIIEDSHLHTRRREDIKSHLLLNFVHKCISSFSLNSHLVFGYMISFPTNIWAQLLAHTYPCCSSWFYIVTVLACLTEYPNTKLMWKFVKPIW
jgi:hypothetical protein